MFSTVLSATLKGLFVEFVHVEADISNGLPILHMVGDLSSEVKEAGERVRTAIKNSGYTMPAKRIVINLSPANIRKRGAMFDLPIAIAILASMGEMEEHLLKDTLVVGELSLDGRVKPIPGVLSMVYEAKKQGCKACIVPWENLNEAKLVEGIRIVGVRSLQDVLYFLQGGELTHLEQKKKKSHVCRQQKNMPDYSEVHGQYFAKRAAEIAVAGNHNLLMIGPPGSGKSMIAKRIPTILPQLTKEESMELTMLYSAIGALDPETPLVTDRPFREVHQTVTRTALLGGGAYPKPGEISLAHKGV